MKLSDLLTQAVVYDRIILVLRSKITEYSKVFEGCMSPEIFQKQFYEYFIKYTRNYFLDILEIQWLFCIQNEKKYRNAEYMAAACKFWGG